MSRNVWLKFDEWELINEELSDQEYHSFKLSRKQVNSWKKDIERYSENENRRFDRVGIYPEVENVKSPRAMNILCREGWRPQDMYYVMSSSHSFIGFILTHCEQVDYDTTFEQWDDIRTKMKNKIDESNKNTWWPEELAELYQKEHGVV